MLTTARKLYDLLGERRSRWLVLTVFAAGVSLLDAAAALLVFALLQMLTSPERGLAVPVAGDLQRFFPDTGTDQVLLVGALIVAGFFLVRGVAYVTQVYFQHRVGQNTAAELAARLVRGYLAMPYAFHLHRNSAELVRNAFDAVQRLAGEVLISLIRIVSEALIVVAIVVVLFVTAPLATLLVIAVFAPTIWLLLRIVQPRLKRLGRTQQDMARATLGSLQQSLAGLRDLKLLGREGFFADEFRRHRRRLARTRYLRGAATMLPRVTIETVLVLFIAVFLAVVVLGDGSPEEAVAVLGLFGYAAFRTLPGLTVILSSLNSLKFAAPTIDDVHTDLMYFDTHGYDVARQPAVRLEMAHQIRAEDLTFRYEGADVDALHEVSLVVPRGATLGIVGPTGGGKTTLVDLLCGLLEPTSGRVTVDGVDIHTNVRGWQSSLGVVPQTVFLLDHTLRRNIAFGFPERDIDDELVREAVRLAQLEEFVASLPEGLETVVGERGVRLSGGQRQRVAIARALYRRPDVLIFDEATSALDAVTERQFMRALRERVGGLGALVMVAHRITTVRDCDQIVVVAGGRITDSGTYDELLERSHGFQELAGGGA